MTPAGVGCACRILGNRQTDDCKSPKVAGGATRDGRSPADGVSCVTWSGAKQRRQSKRHLEDGIPRRTITANSLQSRSTPDKTSRTRCPLAELGESNGLPRNLLDVGRDAPRSLACARPRERI